MALLLAIARRRTFRGNVPHPVASVAVSTAEDMLVHLIQAIAYPGLDTAIQNFLRPSHIGRYAFVRPLAPFICHPIPVIRVGGRLRHAGLPYETRNPALLPVGHPLVKALILQTHQTLGHAGRLTVHNHLRQKFWIPNAVKSIKSIQDKCLVCHRYNAQSEVQLMGQLPAPRVNASRPFLHTGVDLCFPFQLRNFTGRGGRFKVWVSLFTCLATRAIHLEIVSSLSQFGFLLAFRRFISRRGIPTVMYSDNGTNFVGANNHLTNVMARRLITQGLANTLLLSLDLDRITWKFNPPSSPSQGGVWEAMIKTVKVDLRKISDDTDYTWEQFESLLVFVESIINSRPLTPVSEDPLDLEALTPAHFLIGTTAAMIPDDGLTHLRLNRLDRYQLVLCMYVLVG